MTEKGSLDISFHFSQGKPTYSKIEQALRRNGIAVMRSGNRDKITIGRDGKTVVIYGNCLYSPSRDKGEVPHEKWLRDIVDKAKSEVGNFTEHIESSGASHHRPGEKYSHHKKGKY